MGTGCDTLSITDAPVLCIAVWKAQDPRVAYILSEGPVLMESFTMMGMP